MAKKERQLDVLMDWFLKHPGEGITGREIDYELGIMNYKGRVSDVRKLGLPIRRDWREVQNRYGGTSRIAVYTLPADWTSEAQA